MGGPSRPVGEPVARGPVETELEASAGMPVAEKGAEAREAGAMGQARMAAVVKVVEPMVKGVEGSVEDTPTWARAARPRAVVRAAAKAAARARSMAAARAAARVGLASAARLATRAEVEGCLPASQSQ